MIAWINFAILVIASFFFLYYYVLSVSPAALERLTGPGAYQKCGNLRVVAILFELITVINYVVYYYYPLPTPLPKTFAWPHWMSVMLAFALLLPSATLMIVGMLHAGEEASRPKKEHQMYTGIYKFIRHPQAAGEVFIWWVVALFLNSPFLTVFSFIFVPIFLLMCAAEDHDLVLRFGDEFVSYYRSTGAFWPKLGTFRKV